LCKTISKMDDRQPL